MIDVTAEAAPEAAASERVAAAADDDLLLLRQMLLLRAYDERAVTLQRQGRLSAYPMFWGEEGIQAGALAAVRESDWLFPTYRQNALPVLRGAPPEQVLSYFNGDPRGLLDPRRYACAPQCVPVATQIPHAVGWAWGRANAGSDDVAVVFFGDGATSEGDFHEGVNLAGVLRAPVVLLCTNNGWAISTPVARQTAAKAIVDKAAGYGIVGVQVDGFDARAVRDVVAVAAERARAGAGPTLVEATCYRIGPHATADDPARYRDPAVAETWRAHEPVARLADSLLARGLLTEDELELERANAHARMVEASERLAAQGPVDRRRLIEHVHVEPPPLLEAQLGGRTA
ncbi:MAG TPA: thiamine pyrophosphate-dependent enzyme [Conexibacter sp.]|nr:thiamine pyrophosphate-dependent enzyme [Conexibacter sp.]